MNINKLVMVLIKKLLEIHYIQFMSKNNSFVDMNLVYEHK